MTKLTVTDYLSDGDQIPIFSTSNGDTRKTSLNSLADYIMGKITSVDDFLTQYYAPSATGFSVQLNNANLNVWLILTPVADYAAGTLILPLMMNCIDRQELLINTTHAITTLTINGNGSSVVGAPTTLAANGFFKLRFDGVTKTWYRVI